MQKTRVMFPSLKISFARFGQSQFNSCTTIHSSAPASRLRTGLVHKTFQEGSAENSQALVYIKARFI